MRVATKLTGAFGLFIIMLVGLLLFHIHTIQRVVDTNYELSDLSDRVYLASTRQVARIGRLEEHASKYRVTLDSGYLERFVEARDTFQVALSDLEAGPLTPAESAELGRLNETWSEFLAAAQGLEAVTQPAGGRAAPDYLLPTLHQHLDALRTQTQSLGEATQAAMALRLEESAGAARRVERVSWITIAGALVLGITGSGLIIHSIAEALRQLQAGTREVAAGNFSHRLDTRRNDEFAQLAHDFNVMTRQLGELDQMKKDFLSKVSHDLKTPLASMRETTQVLLEEVPGPLTERQQRLLHLNHQSGERLSTMIAKILELSAMEAGVLRLEAGRHDLVALVHHALQEIDIVSRDHEIQIETTFSDTPLEIVGDGDRIIRVLVNLLENAVKFSPRGGTIRVAVQSTDHLYGERLPESATGASDAALITVADLGPGIADSEKEKVFERFYQAESGKRVYGRGVGLGLTICREIVEAHRGALWVSDNPGGGSIFFLLLPRMGVEAPARSSTAAAAAPDRQRYEA